MSRMRQIGIVGTGAAGLLLLYQMEKAGIQPRRIVVIDPYHDGGDLKRKWGTVRSNTIWRQILEACPPPSGRSLPAPWSALDPEKPCELGLIIDYLWFLVKPYFQQTQIRSDWVREASQNAETMIWRLQLQNSATPIEVAYLFLATGSDPKSLDLPKPSIPLEVALAGQDRLSQYVRKGQQAVVFGLSHSGTLAVQNLLDAGLKVVAFYATPHPFLYARDGIYDGIKQDSAEIADKLAARAYGSNFQMYPVSNTAECLRATMLADVVIFAIGFDPRRLLLKHFEYDSRTGALKDLVNGWGFGIAYPNIAPDGIHYDVSVPAFIKHIEAQWSSIVSSVVIDE